MGAILQTIFWRCIFVNEKFSIFTKISLRIIPTGPVWRQAIISTNADPIHWHIYAALGGDELIHWDRVTHLCVSEFTFVGSHDGLSPGQCQAIIWTNAGILLIWLFGTNFSEILIKIHIFSYNNMHCKISSAKCQPFCLSLNVLKGTTWWQCIWKLCCYTNMIVAAGIVIMTSLSWNAYCGITQKLCCLKFWHQIS